MHHELWMTIFRFLAFKVMNAAWNYGKQLVQAAGGWNTLNALKRLGVPGWQYEWGFSLHYSLISIF
jgi:hypothetical protein